MSLTTSENDVKPNERRFSQVTPPARRTSFVQIGGRRAAAPPKQGTALRSTFTGPLKIGSQAYKSHDNLPIPRGLNRDAIKKSILSIPPPVHCIFNPSGSPSLRTDDDDDDDETKKMIEEAKKKEGIGLSQEIEGVEEEDEETPTDDSYFSEDDERGRQNEGGSAEEEEERGRGGGGGRDSSSHNGVRVPSQAERGNMKRRKSDEEEQNGNEYGGGTPLSPVRVSLQGSHLSASSPTGAASYTSESSQSSSSPSSSSSSPSPSHNSTGSTPGSPHSWRTSRDKRTSTLVSELTASPESDTKAQESVVANIPIRPARSNRRPPPSPNAQPGTPKLSPRPSGASSLSGTPKLSPRPSGSSSLSGPPKLSPRPSGASSVPRLSPRPPAPPRSPRVPQEESIKQAEESPPEAQLTPPSSSTTKGKMTPEKMEELELLFNEGKDLYTQELFEDSRHCLEEAARKGHNGAANALGWLYHHGEGVPKSPNIAMEWFMMAADNGDAAAMNNIGWLYQKGLGVDEDMSKAMVWFTKASDNGHAAAGANIAFMHRKGLGVPLDMNKAYEWYSLAAEKGDPASLCTAGWMLAQGTGTAKNPIKAVEYLATAVSLGFEEALDRLFFVFINRLNMRRDKLQKALQEAEGEAFTENCVALAHIMNAASTAHEEARRWYLLAAEKGDDRGLVRLEKRANSKSFFRKLIPGDRKGKSSASSSPRVQTRNRSNTAQKMIRSASTQLMS